MQELSGALPHNLPWDVMRPLGESGPLYLWTEDPSFFLKEGQLGKNGLARFFPVEFDHGKIPSQRISKRKGTKTDWSGPARS